MDYSGLSGILFGIQTAIFLAVYFAIYHPIREAESKLIGNKNLVKIKRHLFKLIISETGLFLKSFGIFILVSLVGLILSFTNKLDGLGFLLVIISILPFSVSLGEMRRYYYKYVIKRKNIFEAETTREILKIFEIKKSYLNNIDNFLNKAKDKDNLLNWILDGVYYYEDGKITEGKK